MTLATYDLHNLVLGWWSTGIQVFEWLFFLLRGEPPQRPPVAGEPRGFIGQETPP